MRGYVIRRFQVAGNIENEPGMPLIPGNHVMCIGFTPDIDVICWGTSPGDVHITTGERSGLVMNGYITESPDLGLFETQVEAASLIRVFIEHHHDNAAIMSAFLHGLNGCFSLVYVHYADSRIVTITDRVKSRPVWLGEGNDCLAIGSNPLTVASLVGAADYDPGALGSLMLYGSQLNHIHSLYPEVRSLDSGMVRICHPNNVSMTHRWYLFHHAPDNGRSQGEWVDYITERLERAATRILRISPNILVFLSGGPRLTAGLCRVAGGGRNTAHGHDGGFREYRAFNRP